MPEFFDIDITKSLLAAIDDFEAFDSMFSAFQNDKDIHILLGEELGYDYQAQYGFVFTRYVTPLNTTGEIGVLGSTRLNYTNVIPTVRYFGNLIEEVAKGW